MVGVTCDPHAKTAPDDVCGVGLREEFNQPIKDENKDAEMNNTNLIH